MSKFKSNTFSSLIWPLRGLSPKGDGANMGAGSPWPSKSTCSRKWVSLSNKWMFLINQLQWLAQVRLWELNSLSFCVVHLFRFMGEDGRETKQWTLDLLEGSHYACSRNPCWGTSNIMWSCSIDHELFLPNQNLNGWTLFQGNLYWSPLIIHTYAETSFFGDVIHFK